MANEQAASNVDVPPALHAVPSQVLADILQWSSTLPLWQQEAMRQLFKTSELDEKAKENLFQLACIELKLLAGVLPCKPLSAQDLPIAQVVMGTKLTGLKQLENVNAIKSDQRISVGKALTVVYGDNASGKSGYARVLKKACRSRLAEPILPNVYTTPTVTKAATAIFEFESDANSGEENWADGGASPSWLGRFAVFDAGCARVYISNANEPQLMPFGLDVLPKLASVIDDIKSRLDRQAALPAPNIDALKNSVKPGSAVAQLLSALSASTQPQFIDRLAIFSESDEQTVTGLQQQLRDLQLNSPEELRRKITEQRSYVNDLLNRTGALVSALSDEKIETLRRSREQLKALEQAERAAGIEQFAGAAVPGVGSAAWRELFLAAEKYSETVAYPQQQFPAQNSNCVLCHQSLTPDAHSRLQHFREFVGNETAKKRHAAKQEFDANLDAIERLDTKLPSYQHSLEKILGQDGLTAVSVFFDACKKRWSDVVLCAKSDTWIAVSASASTPEAIGKAQTALQEQWSRLEGQASNADAITVVQGQISELDARRLLKQNLAVVHEHLKALQSQSAYSTASTSLNSRSVSTKAKAMQTKYLTEQFKVSLLTELNKAGVSKIIPKITEKNPKGKLMRELGVSCGLNVSPEAVFSEGERTAIGLAFFMAELGTEHDTSGVIFDDPVTSLDHKVRASIADRLVEESKMRQVIVFTHDLVFFRDLLSTATKQQVDAVVQCVDKIGEYTGVVSARPPWDASPVKDRVVVLKSLQQRIVEAEASTDIEGRSIAIESFYKRLRATWERVVEEFLFSGVVARFERGVSTQLLISATLDDDTIASVFDSMSTTSQRLHDNATGVAEAQPSLDDVKKDLGVLEQFIKDHPAKKKTVEERRKHLKGKIK